MKGACEGEKEGKGGFTERKEGDPCPTTKSPRKRILL